MKIINKYIALLFLCSLSVFSFAQDMRLTVDIDSLYVPNVCDGGCKENKCTKDRHKIELFWKFQIRVFEVDGVGNEILADEGAEYQFEKQVCERDRDEWYDFNENILFGPSQRSEIYDRFFDFDITKRYKVSIRYVLVEIDDGWFDDFIDFNPDDGLCNQWSNWNFADEFFLDAGIGCGSIDDMSVTGGCNGEEYKLKVGWQVNHLSVPDQKIYCSNDLGKGKYLSEELKYDVHGYNGIFRQYDYSVPDEQQYTDTQTEIATADLIASGIPPINIWHWVYEWRDANGTLLYNSFDNIDDPSFQEIPITEPGIYTVSAGFYRMHLNGNIENEPAALNTVATINIIEEQAPILDHVGPADQYSPADPDYPYYVCPGEILTLGDDYLPVNPGNLVTTSPKEKDVVKDGLEYYWAYFPGMAPEDDLNLDMLPQGRCLGYTKSMNFTQSGKYLLRITHHHQNQFTGDYYFCTSQKQFSIFPGDGPDLVMEPYVELCPENPTYNNGYVTLSAGVCPPGADCDANPNLISTDTGSYGFEWQTGGTTPFITVNAPGIYSVTVTDLTAGCQTSRQLEVIACNEANYDKIVPASLVGRLDNIDTDVDTFSDLKVGSTITVNDPVPCGPITNEVIDRFALVRLNYHRATQSDEEGAQEWVLDIYYTVNGVAPDNLPLRINKLNTHPTYLAINKHQLDKCEQSVVLNITNVIAYHGPVTNNVQVAIEQLPGDIHLELEQQIVYLEELSMTPPVLDAVPALDANHKTTISWPIVPGAVEYELMIAHEDEYIDPNFKVTAALNPDYDAFFEEYGYKIETSENHYTFDATYPSGNLLFRLRAVGRHLENVGNNYSFKKYTDWSGVEIRSIEGFHSGTVSPDKNWQKTITFAEDGKHKEVVSYMDGLLRPEGIVTHLNSDGTVLRAHSFYDYEGRATLQTLPFPEINTSLLFEPSGYEVDVAGVTEPLEEKHFDFGVQPQLLPSYGSAKYFSAFDNTHPFYNHQNRFPGLAYIPDANGYVTTQSVFKRDATGRVARQSGVGETFKLVEGNASHHETRFHYATTTGRELRRLFGSNIGNADHYKKQAVVDPNGQVSVSYMDMQDRVIATALAGNVPDNVVGLGHLKEAISLNLEEKNNWDPYSNSFVLTHEIFNSAINTNYSFAYDIETVVNKMSYLFPGRTETFGQHYNTESDLDNWLFIGGTGTVSNGFLELSKDPASPDFSTSLTIDTEQNNEYTITAKFVDLDASAEIKLINNGIATTLTLNGGALFYPFTANATTVKLEIGFPGLTASGPVGKVDFVKLYEPEILPVLHTALEFEGTDITDDGDPATTHITWTGEDIAGLSSASNDGFLEMREILSDGNNNIFSTTLEVQVENNGATASSYEVFFNASSFDPELDIQFSINGNPSADLEVLNIHPFTVAPGGETISFTWAASLQDVLINDPFAFEVDILELNYFKIYEIATAASPDIFENCEACEYNFTTYIVDDFGREVELTSEGQQLFKIEQTIKSGETDCSAVGGTAPVGENLFDLEMGSQLFNNGNTLLENGSPVSPNCNNCFLLSFPLSTTAESGYNISINNSFTVKREGLADVVIPISPATLVTHNGTAFVPATDLSTLESEINSYTIFGFSFFSVEIRNGFMYLIQTSVSESIINIEVSLSESPASNNNTAISLAPKPEISFTANFPDIGTYTIHKELKLSPAAVEAFLEQQKEIIKEGFLYNFIKEQEAITDMGTLCAYTCEDACIALVVAQLNLENGFDDLDPDRLKTETLKACLEDPTCPDMEDWSLRFEQCKADNLCDSSDLFSGPLATESAAAACEGMLGEMKRQISEPESFYAPVDGTDEARANKFYEFLYNPESLGTVDFSGENDYIPSELDKIKAWVDDFVNACNNVNTESLYGYDLNFGSSASLKGQFLYEHWNGVISTAELDFFATENITLPEYTNEDYPDESWEDWYVFYHREYFHYEKCVEDIEGKAFVLRMRTEATNWEEAKALGYLYPLSTAAQNNFETGVTNGTTPQFENISAGVADPYMEPLAGSFRSDYLDNFALDFNESNISLWQYLDPDGDYACILYAVDETHQYSETVLANNGGNPPSDIANCWPDEPGFQHYYSSEVRWQKFVDHYSGQREKFKADQCIANDGQFFDDEFAIVTYPLDSREEIENYFGGEVQEEMCTSQCEQNVERWINDLQYYCNPDGNGHTFTPAELALLNNVLSDLCLANCDYAMLLAYLTQEDIDELESILNNTNIDCLQTLVSNYEMASPEDQLNHELESIFITRATTVSIADAANCPATCTQNVTNWIAGIEQYCSLSVTDRDFLTDNLTLLCNNVCGQSNPLGWLYDEHYGYLYDLLQNLPDGSCTELSGNELIIDEIFLADEWLIVQGDVSYEICQDSGCLQDIVEHFWINDGLPADFQSDTCSFDFINFQEDHIILADTICPDSNCFTSLFWVDANGQRVDLPAGSQITDIAFSRSSPLNTPIAQGGLVPAFANYQAYIHDDNSAGSIGGTALWCDYNALRSSYTPLHNGLSVPYVIQIFNDNGMPLQDGAGNNILDGTQKYYLYPVSGQLSIADLNAILRIAFNSNRETIISFTPHQKFIPTSTPTVNIFDCASNLAAQNLNASELIAFENCIASSLETTGQYLAADYINCLGMISPLQLASCEDISFEKQYAYSFNFYDVPQSQNIAALNFVFGNGNENLAITNESNCTNHPVIAGDCPQECNYETGQSALTTNNNPYISQIYKADGTPMLSGNINYYLKSGTYTLNDLEAVLAANLGSPVNISFDETTVTINGCPDCPLPATSACACFGHQEMLAQSDFILTKIFVAGGDYGLAHSGGQALVSYDSGTGYSINETAVATIEQNLQLVLGPGVNFEVSISGTLPYSSSSVALKVLNLPADVTGLTYQTTTGFGAFDVYSDDCNFCGGTNPLDCQQYIDALNNFNVPIPDPSDCLAVEDVYNSMIAPAITQQYAFTLYFNNVTESIGGDFNVVLNATSTSQNLAATLVPDSCTPSNNCAGSGEQIYLYAISFDHTGAACGVLSQNCDEYFPPVNVLVPGGSIRTIYEEPTTEELDQECVENWATDILFAAENAFEDSWADLQYDMIDAFLDNCKLVEEDFYYQYTLDEYHYTLYYYDNSGSLLQTVPPEGVQPLSESSFTNGNWNGVDEPQHYLRTRYKYNSRNQPVWQNTPDAGISQFWYNVAGQLVLSQNGQQAEDHQYSFTAYDEHGRITWVGEIDLDSVTDFAIDYGPVSDPAALEAFRDATIYNIDFPFNDNKLTAGIQALTYTIYDKAVYVPGLVQENLRNRVSASYRFDNYADYSSWQAVNLDNINFTAYSYDEIGNVNSLIQHVSVDDITQHKKIDYEYDLISGNVNRVVYQKGATDQFMHRYEYDADNRITDVYTSKDGVIEQLEAEYFYYPHGPFARVEIGNDKVQAMDYYYTLQGWIKGVNGKGSDDPGQDGFTPGSLNSFIAKDEFAYQLGYYNGDYTSIATSTINKTDNLWNPTAAFGSNTWAAHEDDPLYNNIVHGNSLPNNSYQYEGLYNGNIGQMMSWLPSLADKKTLYNHYQYDQLHRIKGAVGIAENNGGTFVQKFQTNYNYDAVGNILNLYRKVDNQDMDQFSYDYNYDAFYSNHLSNNKLKRVADGGIDPNAFNTDIDHQSIDLDIGLPDALPGVDNYIYDKIGNLIADASEEIAEIKWDVYGKVSEIIRTLNSTKPNLEFRYDAAGNRVTKIVKEKGTLNTGDPIPPHYTHYIRDAQGNILATYEEEYQDILNNDPTDYPADRRFVLEHNIYGSSRLGIFKDISYNPPSLLDANSNGDFSWMKSCKLFEQSNHLGNVLAVVSDLKRFDPAAGIYKSEVVSVQDYFPFGMGLTGRSGTFEGGPKGLYRFGFNGKEKYENGEFGSVTYLAFEARIYNPAIGKFLSVDPWTKKYSWQTPYAYHRNSPIAVSDWNGLGDPPEPNMLKSRHVLGKLNGVAKSNNSVLTSDISASQLKSLYQEALSLGVKDGNVTLKNGQTWYLNSSSGKFHPVSGKGIVNLTRAEIQLIGTMNKQLRGGASAEKALSNMANAIDNIGMSKSEGFQKAMTKLSSIHGIEEGLMVDKLGVKRAASAAEMSASESRFGANRNLKYLKWGGRALVLVGLAYTGYEIHESGYSTRKITSEVTGWIAAGAASSATGSALSPALATGPWGWAAWGAGTVGSGVIAYFSTKYITETVYDYFFEDIKLRDVFKD